VRKIIALVRASWLEAVSYRMKSVLTLVGLLVASVPFFYVARGLQPLVGQAIEREGGDYFSFLVVGMVAFTFMRTAIGTLPEEVGGAIGNGTFEALLGTPTRLPTLLVGMVGYAFTWAAVRTIVFVGFAWFMGAHLLWSRLPLGLGVLSVIVLAHLPFGLMAAALIVAFRASGPLQSGVIWVSTILGGVYYPTQVIPKYLEAISAFVPLTYGLRALRRAMLEPTATMAEVAPDVARVVVIGVILFGLSVAAFAAALQHARRAGTLAQY
jgi:ABC-2 type transport system permease protein